MLLNLRRKDTLNYRSCIGAHNRISMRCRCLFEMLHLYKMKMEARAAVEPIAGLINLEIYSEGDAAFKKEFVMQILKNLDELKSALALSQETKQTNLFCQAVHKIKPTIAILGDTEFTGLLDSIVGKMSEKEEFPDAAESAKFQSRWSYLKTRLQQELAGI